MDFLCCKIGCSHLHGISAKHCSPERCLPIINTSSYNYLSSREDFRRFLPQDKCSLTKGQSGIFAHVPTSFIAFKDHKIGTGLHCKLKQTDCSSKIDDTNTKFGKSFDKCGITSGNRNKWRPDFFYPDKLFIPERIFIKQQRVD